MKNLFARLMRNDKGQDLIEYALLTAFVGLASAAALSIIGGAVHDTYGSWGTGINDLWETPNPG